MDDEKTYLLRGVPSTLWRRIRVKALDNDVSVRAVILALLDGWVNERIRISSSDLGKYNSDREKDGT